MFDVWKSIFAGFTGQLKDHQEARRLVWLLIITGFFSVCCVFFAAYVSFSRYRDLAGILPGADFVAICFTIGIAGFIFFASAYIATFTAELWIHGRTDMAGARAITFFVVGLVVAIGDYQMNIDGADDVAQAAVGKMEVIDEDAIRAIYAADIKAEEQKLQDLLAGNLGGYGWRNTETGIYHLNRSGKTFQRSISKNIENLRSQEDQSIKDARNRIKDSNADRKDRKAQTKSRLVVVVRSVYIIQFFLCLVMALIGVSMTEAMDGTKPSENASSIGFKKSKKDTEPKQAKDKKEEKKANPNSQKKAPSNPFSIEAQLARLKGDKKEAKTPKKVSQKIKSEDKQNFAQSFDKNEKPESNKNQGNKTFNFFANKPPDNTGKSYDMTPSELRKIKKVHRAYESLTKSKNGLPTQSEVAVRAKMSRPTASKYLKMLELPTKGKS